MDSMEIITAYLAQILSMKTIKMIASGIVMAFSFLVGEVNMALYACGVLYIADFICGISINAYYGRFSWFKLRKGIFKFILYGIAIIVGNMLDLLVVHNQVEFGAQNIIVIYLGVTEALSVLKHLASMGLHIPIKLINRLEGMRDELDTPGSQPLTVSPLTQKGTFTSPFPTPSQDSQTEV